MDWHRLMTDGGEGTPHTSPSHLIHPGPPIGSVPAEVRFLDPIPDPGLKGGIPVPESVVRLLRGGRP